MRYLLVTIALALTMVLIIMAGISNVAYGQELRGSYVVRIPPGAAQGNADHYVPMQIAVPTGTTIVWFNDDPDQTHTVTSGISEDDEGAGSEFDSGVFNEGTFFQHTFEEAGEYTYHCAFHQGMTAIISVGDETMEGENFILSSGAGAPFDFTEHERNLLRIEPTFADIPEDEPVTYQLSILKDGEEVFSEEFRTLGGNLHVELIPTDNQTSVIGPDISDPIIGAYHIEGSFLKDNAAYTVKVEVTQLFDRPPNGEITDEFSLQIIPEFPVAAFAATIGVAGTIAYTRRRGFHTRT